MGPKPLLKIRTVNKSGCFDIKASSLLALSHIFFRNKTFFFKIESWNCQHLFKKNFVKPHKISSQSENRWKNENKSCLNELKFHEISRNFTKFFFKQLLKVSAFYLEKQKSFIPKKSDPPLKYDLSRSL